MKGYCISCSENLQAFSCRHRRGTPRVHGAHMATHIRQDRFGRSNNWEIPITGQSQLAGSASRAWTCLKYTFFWTLANRGIRISNKNKSSPCGSKVICLDVIGNEAFILIYSYVYNRPSKSDSLLRSLEAEISLSFSGQPFRHYGRSCSADFEDPPSKK